mmetsp:Transcript_5593/g.18001  ORF Transcript_5593/g.18001 Transcript_5593/m.18001 type:complete len:201 (-) Transcript_5593:186-788(-)
MHARRTPPALRAAAARALAPRFPALRDGVRPRLLPPLLSGAREAPAAAAAARRSSLHGAPACVRLVRAARRLLHVSAPGARRAPARLLRLPARLWRARRCPHAADGGGRQRDGGRPSPRRLPRRDGRAPRRRGGPAAAAPLPRPARRRLLRLRVLPPRRRLRRLPACAVAHDRHRAAAHAARRRRHDRPGEAKGEVIDLS